MKAAVAWIACGMMLALAWGAGAVETPAWKHLTSKKGELPEPNGGTQQTCCVVFDIDGDGARDIVTGERTKPPALVWTRHTARGWQKLVLDDSGVTPEAGGVAYDVDGDGDLDLIVGGDYQGNELWWYENPKPAFDPAKPWTRRLIFKAPGKAFHDQAIADFKGNGKAQLMFWCQGARKLYMAEIPAAPRQAPSWPTVEILDTARVKTAIKQEGMDACDVDGDGKVDLLAGLYWFKHVEGNTFKPIQIADHPGRIAAGRFMQGKTAQVVMAPGDGDGPLTLLECAGDPAAPKAWTKRDLLGCTVIHGHTLALADINGDGALDILCGEMAKWTNRKTPADNPQAKSWILYGDGKGAFTVTELATGIAFHEGRAADVDGDGKIDIVDKPYNWDAPRLDVWLNQGNR